MNDYASSPKKWLILLNVSLSVFMSTLDGSIVNNALPVIARRLSVNIGQIQWVVTAYLLTISVLLPIWGRLSDLYGKKYIFAFGFFGFTLGSLFCGLSKTLTMLVVSRILQAMGASAMMALSQGIVTVVFPPQQRGRALGINGTMVALGSLTGPSLGGVLVSAFSWESIFFLNVPVGLIGLLLTFWILPKISGEPDGHRFDYAGTVLFSAALLLLFIGLLSLQDGTISPAVFFVLFVLAAASAAGFLLRERRAPSPLIQLRLFRIPVFSFGLIAAYLAFIASNAVLYFLPFYLQDILSLSPLQAGLIVSFFPVSMMIVAPLSGWLSDRISYRPLTIGGMALATAGILLYLTLTPKSPLGLIAACTVVYGVGNAMFQSPNNSSVMGSVPKGQLGIAGSINALFRNLGMVSGTAFSVLLFSLVTRAGVNALSQSGGMSAGTFMAGLRWVFALCACCTAAAAVLSLARAVTAGAPGGPAAPDSPSGS